MKKYINSKKTSLMFCLLFFILMFAKISFAGQVHLRLMEVFPHHHFMYSLINNTDKSIAFNIQSNNKTLRINPIMSTCHQNLSAKKACRLMLTMSPSKKNKSFLAINTAKQIIKLPLNLNNQSTNKNNIKNSNSLHWQPVGPFTGIVEDEVASPVNPNILFIAVYGAGVFKSTDAGKTWVNVSNNLPELYVTQLLFHQNNLYVVTYDKGIYRSSDNGDHWVDASNGLSTTFGLNVKDLVPDDNTLYAVDYYIYRSIDGGAHWVSTKTFPQGYSPQTLLSNGNTLYVGTYNHGVYKSTNNGKNWFPANHGIENANITSLMEDHGVIYAGSPNYSEKGALYKSIDQGKTWINLSSRFGAVRINSLSKYNHSLYAATSVGIFRAIEGRGDWTLINSNLKSHEIYSIKGFNSILYAGGPFGFYISYDNGSQWQPANTGINGAWIQCLLALPDNKTIFAVTINNEIFKSVDNGLSFVKSDHGIKPNPSLLGITELTLNKTNGDIYAVSPTYIARSTDDGQNWKNINLPHNDNGDRVTASYLVIKNSKLYLGAIDDGGFVSDDNGTSWKPLAANQPIIGNPRTIFSMVILKNTLFIGGQGLTKTTLDKDGHWENVPGIPVLNTIPDLKTIPNGTADGLFYAATSQGLYRSYNAGKTWEIVDHGLPTNVGIKRITNQGNNLVVATNTGLYLSTDNAQSWQAANDGMTNSASVTDLVDNNQFIFAGTPSSVFRALSNSVDKKK